MAGRLNKYGVPTGVSGYTHGICRAPARTFWPPSLTARRHGRGALEWVVTRS